MKKLHETQKRLLDLLKTHLNDPLTIRELQDHLDISSPSVVHHHIQQLEKKGYLRRNPTNPQDYQIMDEQPENSIVYLNLYGLASCGPSGSILDGSPVDKIPIAARLLGFSSKLAYLVKAKGNSMQPKINPGDLVIVKREKQCAEGDITVCVNNGDVLIKKVHYEQDNIMLLSTNTEFAPIIANKDNFHIEGIVRGVISYTL